jgi:hypothetical protein
MKTHHFLVLVAGIVAILSACGNDKPPAEPPGAGLGIPWATCTNKPTDCKDADFALTPIGKEPHMKNVKCKSNWCRADLTDGKQCVAGSTAPCGSQGSGTTSCSGEGWTDCSAN